jgi:acyl-CoA synthetase (NDP forming)
MLHPRSVAVYGASDSRDKFGGRIMYFLVHHGFAGEIVPINPRRSEVRGRRAYARAADAPNPIDVAILAVPSDALLDAVQECAAAGVRCCVIITTGFAEAHAEGKRAQQRILEIAEAAGMRIVGPNCMGFLNPAWKLALCSSVVLDVEQLLVGHIGMVSQSGALMVSTFDRAQADGIGFSACVSLGNQADVEICDVLEYLIADPDTHAVCVYVEGFRDAARFFRAAAACREAGKPLVVLKTGKTPAGVKAAQSHTASLAGSYQAFEALCRTHGVVLADDPMLMVRIADVLVRWPHGQGDGIGIVSGSGGGAGVMADRITGAGLQLATLSEGSRAALGTILLPPQADNPIDFGGRLSQEGEIDDTATSILATDPDVGVIMPYLSSMPTFAVRTRAIATAALRSGKPVFALVAVGHAGATPRRELRAVDCPYFDSAEDALAVLRAVIGYYRRTPRQSPPVRRGGLPASLPHGMEPADLFRSYGVPFPAEAMCADVEAAIQAAERIGYPVVLKGLVPGVVHKTDLGLVRLDIADATALRAAWREIAASVAASVAAGGHVGGLSGCLVQERVAAGLELIIGIRRDPSYGPLVVVGAGGILVEFLNDIASAPAPLAHDDAERLLRSLRLAPLFAGVRGRPALDIAAAAEVVVRLSWLAFDLGDNWVDAEISPLIVAPVGSGARAVDVRADFGRADFGPADA